MSYRDRLRELRYTSAENATEFTLSFDELSRERGKKSAVTEFPNRDQGAVEDLGNLTPRFSVSCYISGPDYDREADRFWDALHEKGFGVLSHPRWGNLNVLPLPSAQTEAFVDGAGRAQFDIEFVRVDDDVSDYPRSEVDEADRVRSIVDQSFREVTASLEGVEVDEPGALAQLKDNVLDGIAAAQDKLDAITGITNRVRRRIAETVRDIERRIDTLVETPADLMSSLITLYRLPAREAVNIKAKIDGYTQLYSDLIQGFKNTTRDYGETLGLINTSNANAIVIAAAEATTAGEIETRDLAIAAVNNLDAFDSDVSDDIEALEKSGGFSADSESRSAVSDAAASAIGSLIGRSIQLPSERAFILDRDVTPIELAYELDGHLDRLDFLIRYNELSGNEILIIPSGREIRWYE